MGNHFEKFSFVHILVHPKEEFFFFLSSSTSSAAAVFKIRRLRGSVALYFERILLEFGVRKFQDLNPERTSSPLGPTSLELRLNQTLSFLSITSDF